MSNPNQLFLLADHIKLSLLERQRVRSLGPDSDSQDGHVSRSLDQFHDGVGALEREQARLVQAGDQAAADGLSESLTALRKLLDNLTSQFQGFPELSASSEPSPPGLSSSPNSSSSSDSANRKPKTVRFNDTTSSLSPAAAAAAATSQHDRNHQDLFGRYRDDPDASPGYTDHAAAMSNDQIHQYHSQIMQEQDDHLDRLGESIGRQRELSMQIGDELESHVVMLDDVDDVVVRHQSRLDRAKRSLNRVAKAAAKNKQMTAIIVLIVILVLLIAILK